MAKIKICGLKRKEDIEFVNAAKPDFAGFVFAGEKRKIDFKTAETFRAALDENILSAGVFINEPIENVIALRKEKIINLIQLHGGESEEYINELKEKTGSEIIKTIKINAHTSKDDLNTKADFLLFDSGGGSGKTFDWNLIKGVKEKPFFLAGGLNKDNVIKAIELLNPHCVDISSGVETDGVKDFEKIKEIIKIVRKL